LTSALGTTTRDTWDTGNGATGTPGFSGVLVASLAGDSVGLAVVLVDVGVDEGDDVWADWGGQDGWKGDLGDDLDGIVGDGEDGDNWTGGSHGENALV